MDFSARPRCWIMIYWQGQTSPNPKFILTMSISISILDFFFPKLALVFDLMPSRQTSPNPKFILMSISTSNSIFKLFPSQEWKKYDLLTKQNLPPSLNSYWQPFQTSIFNDSPPQFNRDFLLSDKTKPHPNPKFILSRPISKYVVLIKNANRNYSIFHNLWHSVKNWAPWTDQLIG